MKKKGVRMGSSHIGNCDMISSGPLFLITEAGPYPDQDEVPPPPPPPM